MGDAPVVQEAAAAIDFDAELSVHGFCSFYANEFAWGEDVASVRLGEKRKAADFRTLKREYPYMPADEAKYMLHIEDPIDVERNLNCVLNPGSVYKLWDAMHAEAAKSAKERKPRRRTWPGSPRCESSELDCCCNGSGRPAGQ